MEKASPGNVDSVNQPPLPPHELTQAAGKCGVFIGVECSDPGRGYQHKNKGKVFTTDV